MAGLASATDKLKQDLSEMARNPALRRLEQLIQEAVVTVPRALIAETIDLVAVLSGRGAARRLTELARVEGIGTDTDYRLSPATQPPDPKGEPA